MSRSQKDKNIMGSIDFNGTKSILIQENLEHSSPNTLPQRKSL